MELKKIRYFLTIVDEGSLSAAAKHLYLAQPTLSRFLAALEEEVGTPLFYRNKHSGLALTPAGQAYLKTARQIDALYSSLDADLAVFRKQKDEILFGVHGDYLLPFAADCAQQVMQRWPEVRVRFRCHNSPELQQLVAEGQLHLGLCAYEQEDPRLSYTLCSKTEMMLVTVKAHPLAQSAAPARRLSMETLPPSTGFALMQEHSVLRCCAQQYLNRLPHTPDIRQTYRRHSSLAGILAADHELVGFCPANNYSEKLAYLPLENPVYYRQGICHPQTPPRSAAERFLISLLKQIPDRSLD